MFLAAGLDLSLEPCPMVVMDKTGTVLEIREEERPIDCIVSSLESIACSSGKIVYCAISKQDAYELEVHYRCRLRKSAVYIKAYDHTFLMRIENLLRDSREGTPSKAYCLAKIVQSEALDLTTHQEDIKKLYDLKETLDRVLVHLSTLHAFPDDSHVLGRW